ncbi:shikimate kinase [Campylobacter sp. RM9344]|uniref:Shikimate kinase n=1 Tax=Campylobacter californiensis TaxID=1032243 RepID=A0AAW3ZYV3_9BACT|nr:shikimate kinase [Campylobacter sp. RM9337]MBE3029720.1 shikimate kinase [Campylobacter sp. RM9344]MBE3608650.1 shikimate kinase [Campylobacter sp. RM9337]
MKIKNNNIVLIGFMGVGKGTVARALSKNLKTMNLDCDDLIESSANMKIKDIFSTYGETYFRNLEKTLAKFLASSVRNAIISTGGGFIHAKDIKKIGTTIYLKSSFDAIITRMQNSENSEKKFAKRPLLKDPNKARELFNSRVEMYEKKADITINVENKTPKQIVKEIKKALSLKDKN